MYSFLLFSLSPTTLSTEELKESLLIVLHRDSHLEVAGKRKRLCFKHFDRVNTAELSQKAAITVRTDSLTVQFFFPPTGSHLLSLFLLMTSIISNEAINSASVYFRKIIKVALCEKRLIWTGDHSWWAVCHFFCSLILTSQPTKASKRNSVFSLSMLKPFTFLLHSWNIGIILSFIFSLSVSQTGLINF